MHRWHFQRLFRWLIPTLVFIVALCALIIEQKASGGGLSFPDDSAYRDLAVARNLVQQHAYSLFGTESMPVVRDGLWQLTLAVVGPLVGSYTAAAYLLGTVCCLLTLLMCLRMARMLFPFPPFILYTVILMIIAPNLLLMAIDGSSLALATTLVTAAALLHVEGLLDRRPPLPLLSAAMVGLLMWIRLEFAIVWIVLVLHAIVVSAYRRQRDGTVSYVLVRGVAGIMLLVLFAFPLFAWNLHVIRVPWPQSLGAPMTMDQLASLGPAEALAQYGAMAAQGVRASLSQMYETPFLSGVLARWLTWFGVVFVAVLSLWRQEEQAFGIIFAFLLLLPILYALLYPFAGAAPAQTIFPTVGPLCVVAASFGIFRIPFLVESLYRKWKQGLPEAFGFNAWWIVMGSILVVISLVHTGRDVQNRMVKIVAEKHVREAVAGALLQLPDSGQPVVTEKPGWLAYAYELRTVDLVGEASAGILACLDENGRFDRSELETFLFEQRPGAVVIWNADNDLVIEVLPCRALRVKTLDDHSRPRVCAVSSPGVF